MYITNVYLSVRVYVLWIYKDYWLTRGWKPYDVLHIL